MREALDVTEPTIEMIAGVVIIPEAEDAITPARVGAMTLAAEAKITFAVECGSTPAARDAITPTTAETITPATDKGATPADGVMAQVAKRGETITSGQVPQEQAKTASTKSTAGIQPLQTKTAMLMVNQR